MKIEETSPLAEHVREIVRGMSEEQRVEFAAINLAAFLKSRERRYLWSAAATLAFWLTDIPITKAEA